AQPLLRDGSMDFAIGPLHGAQAAQEFACEKLLDYDTAVLLHQGLQDRTDDAPLVDQGAVAPEQLAHQGVV
ncbi:hypothetical protein ACV34F_30655, partial [Pseudomonas aeruginosa]